MCLSCAWHSAFESILYASIAAGMLLTVRWSYWIVRRSHGLGLGDVKLLAMMAAWMRIESTVLAFFVGVVAAATYSVAVLPFLKAEKGGASWLNRRLPLGTFLAAAAIYSVFFSDGTLRWYLSLFPH
jgi:leader peptidase (prepilin peptidase)/N-methyltransferase